MLSRSAEQIILQTFKAKPYDIQAHVWRDELNGAGWINLSNDNRKEIKDGSSKYL